MSSLTSCFGAPRGRLGASWGRQTRTDTETPFFFMAVLLPSAHPPSASPLPAALTPSAPPWAPCRYRGPTYGTNTNCMHQNPIVTRPTHRMGTIEGCRHAAEPDFLEAQRAEALCRCGCCSRFCGSGCIACCGFRVAYQRQCCRGMERRFCGSGCIACCGFRVAASRRAVCHLHGVLER